MGLILGSELVQGSMIIKDDIKHKTFFYILKRPHNQVSKLMTKGMSKCGHLSLAVKPTGSTIAIV